MPDGALMGIGLGLTGAGMLGQAYGNVQGAENMARVRGNQRGQQDAIQQAANAKLRQRVGNIDVAGGLNKATSNLNDDAIKRYSVLNAANPEAGGNYGASLAQTTGGEGMEGMTRGGYLAAPSLFGSRYARDVQDATREQSASAQQAQAASEMYDRQLQEAGNAGQTARLAGGLASAAGPGIANYGIWAQGAQPAASTPPSVARQINPRFTANLFGNDLADPMWGATSPVAATPQIEQAPLVGPRMFGGTARYYNGY